ncbi:conserved hypothetical protein [uncultured Desulfobacterium sp.]|uniref:DUF4881 domain-containing protein n=1 Tax=uncultured Desulfobacterium sp. TaxID=201089 RepID=A0A445N3Z4_9BACT|nr:conserved hypothetical protein [uncultured Desulfobacterium sp.]
MLKKYSILISLMFVFILIGCGDYGNVDQGRVIAYDKANKTMTIILDKSLDRKKPDYSLLPAVEYKLPDDPNEMGPEPKPGRLMKLDLDKKELLVYNAEQKDLMTIAFTLVEQKNVPASDPLVFDKSANKPKSFPIIDNQKKTITTYLGKLKTLVTFTVPEQYAAMPSDTWTFGDEVRIYYKEQGKSLRLMNVSQTDIFKK